MWEYTPPLLDLKYFPPRPKRFLIPGRSAGPYVCASPDWSAKFHAAGIGFQLDVYLGPVSGEKARAHVEAVLNSFRATRDDPRTGRSLAHG